MQALDDLNVDRSTARFNLDTETRLIKSHRPPASHYIYSSIRSGRGECRRITGSFQQCIDHASEPVPFKFLLDECADSVFRVLRDIRWNRSIGVDLVHFLKGLNWRRGFLSLQNRLDPKFRVVPTDLANRHEGAEGIEQVLVEGGARNVSLQPFD